MLPSRLAWAAITVTITSPIENSRHYAIFEASAQVTSTLALRSVTAQIDAGAAVPLAHVSGSTFREYLTAAPLSFGPHTLTITATDAAGATASSQRIFTKDAPPDLVVTAPAYEAVGLGALRIAASCTDDGPEGCVAIEVYTDGVLDFVSGAASLDTVADLSAHAPGDHILTVIAEDSSGGTSATSVPIFIENSPALSALDEAPGRILDFDATRLLFVYPEGGIALLDRATRAVTPILETHPLDYEFVWPPTGALTPSGAVVRATPIEDEELREGVFEWRDGELRALSESGFAHTRGNYMVFSSPAGLQLRELISGTTELVSRTTRGADVDEAGRVVYLDGNEALYVYEAGVSTQLARASASGADRGRPLTDGINIAMAECPPSGSPCTTFLFTPSGNIPLGDTTSDRVRRGSAEDYHLHAGYAAFIRRSLGANQVWLRTPTGEEHQISLFATSSRLENDLSAHHDISDTGEVMFVNPPARYLGAPGAFPREIGSDSGLARWRDGAWHIIEGNTLLGVDVDPGGGSGAGGAGGEGGTGGAGGEGGVGGAAGAGGESSAGEGGSGGAVGEGGSGGAVGEGGSGGAVGEGGSGGAVGEGGSGGAVGEGGSGGAVGEGGSGGGGSGGTGGSGGAGGTGGAGGDAGTGGAATTSASSATAGGSSTSGGTSSTGGADVSGSSAAGSSEPGPGEPQPSGGCAVAPGNAAQRGSMEGLAAAALALAMTARTSRSRRRR
ncbi:hypothetical protein [Sorangium sp. So ce131]|uniref:hypothetical protein n=1 Tax=Sorangium sp. So ce131 TaxID=3133282 RepID=UPI003F5DE6A3